MGVLHGNPFLLASGTATEPTFPVQRSVRMRNSAPAYFSKNMAGTNATTWTASYWFKSGLINSAATPNVFSYAETTGLGRQGGIDSNNGGVTGYEICLYKYTPTTYQCRKVPNMVFRDPSAWYHVVYVWNTTATVAEDRAQIWVNGVRITDWRINTNPAQNETWLWSIFTNNYIGAQNRNNGSVFYPFDGYLTEFNFIDGQALPASAFGGYNAGTGVWEARKYTGTYGTNGFYLNFQDNSNNTATTIGKDSSGNSNNWTPTGINVSAYTGTPPNNISYDSMLDVPTNTGSNNANFPVLNTVAGAASGSSYTITRGNLYAVMTSGASVIEVPATMALPTSGKWYWEVTAVSVNTTYAYPLAIGISDQGGIGTAASFTNNYYYYVSKTGNKFSNGTLTSYGATFTTNDVVGVAFDASAGTLTFYKNNTSQGTAYTGLTGTYYPKIGSNDGSTADINFGQRPFSYTPPSGFKALNTFNLPEPTIPSGDDYHKVYTYTGNGGGLQVGEIQKPLSAFNLDRSLRLRGAASAYLSRTPASAGNRKTWTMAFWVKRGNVSSGQQIWYSGSGSTYFNQCYFEANGTLSWFERTAGGGGSNGLFTTTQAFRDPNMWYHVVCIWDTTQAAQENRMRIYVNNILQSGTWTTYPTLNYDGWFNNTLAHRIGWDGSTGYFDGYLADIYFIDGQPITPTSFGQFDGNNYWTPKAYTGTYGTNGFHLEFEDFSAATAAAIGKDTSGQVNNWTPSAGINLTAPANTNASWDSMVDVPTQTSTDVANFATLNPLNLPRGGTLSNGNLLWTSPLVEAQAVGTIYVSRGKYYWEVVENSVGGCGFGIAKDTTNINSASLNTGGYVYYTNGNKYEATNAFSYGATWTNGDVIGVALDVDAGTLTFYKNGVSQGIAFTGLSGNFTALIVDGTSGATPTYDINFGQRPFKYSNYGVDRPAATFKTLNSFNVAEVTTDIESPDFVWIKSRSAGTGHALFNKVLGTGKYLSSNTTSGETTDVNSLIQFNKNGFLLGNAAIVNTSAATYVASAWKGGGTAVTNTAGTGTSLVSANQISGFSIVTMTNIPTTAGTNTYGHGLNNTPKLIIFKNKDVSDNWYVYHESLGNAAYIRLDLPNPQTTAASIWGTTSPTPSVFTLRNNSLNGTTSQTILAYCFAEIAGFSKFGKYTGNGVAEGPFLYTGFRPRWILFKAYDQTDNWIVFDSARDTYNVVGNLLYPNAVTTEQPSPPRVDFLANGFKIRSGANTPNGGNWNYIYTAFAENPFKYSLAR